MKTVFCTHLLCICTLALTFSCQSPSQQQSFHFPAIPDENTIEAFSADTEQLSVEDAITNENKITIEDFVKPHLPEKQHFTIEPECKKKNVITCAEGTVVQFPSNCFVYADDKTPVTTPVEISVTEYYDYDDMFFANMTTSSKGRLLESGGMIDITASSAGREVEIKGGEYFEVMMPAAFEDPGMQLFYGERTDYGVEWISANPGFSQEMLNTRKIIRTPQFPGGFEGLYRYLNENVKLPEGARTHKLNAHLYLTLQFNEEGMINKITKSKTVSTYADDEVIQAFEKMPSWELPAEKWKNKWLMVPVQLEWVREPDMIPAFLRIENREEQIKYNAAFVLNNYLLVSPKLGLINVDKFIDEQTTTLFVECIDSSDMDMKIVFHELNSMMNGSRTTKGFVFKNVPVGESITIVGLKSENGKPMLAMRDCIITGNPVGELKFQSVSKEELAAKIASLVHRGSDLAWNK